MSNTAKKPDFQIELGLSKKYELIAGVDEVGRGAIAGPIVAAAVIFVDHKRNIGKLEGVNDSKKLTKKSRAAFLGIIQDSAFDYGIGQVSPQKIDLIGIGAANILAFQRALESLKKVDFAIIDGRRFRGFGCPFSCHIKGESLSLSIAASSILAKEFRDNLMRQYATQFPQYSFENNVGYGGREHYAALTEHGPCPLHRRTFLAKFDQIHQQLGLF